MSEDVELYQRRVTTAVSTAAAIQEAMLAVGRERLRAVPQAFRGLVTENLMTMLRHTVERHFRARARPGNAAASESPGNGEEKHE